LYDQYAAAKKINPMVGSIFTTGIESMMKMQEEPRFPNLTSAIEAAQTPDGGFNVLAGLKLLDERGASQKEITEFRLNVDNFKQEDAPDLGLEDRKTFMNVNPESPQYGEVRTYGASEENGQYLWIGPDGERVPKDSDWIDYSYVKDRSPTKETFERMHADLIFEEEGKRKLEQMREARGEAGSGLSFLKNRLSGLYKTILGGKVKLTPKQLAAEEAQKRLNSSIGAFRNEIVGPGIVTEFDAKRIEDALGGSLTTGNFEVVEKLLNDIMLEKTRKTEILRSRLDAARRDNPAFQGEYYNLPDPYEPAQPSGEPGQAQARFNPATGKIEAMEWQRHQQTNASLRCRGLAT
jgi:hypothetical protein